MSIETPNLTAPLREYTRTDTGSRATLISLESLGQPAYYHAVQAAIDERAGQGAAVHCQGTLTRSAQELEALPFPQAVKVLRLRGIASLLAAPLSTLPGLTTPHDSLEYHPTWHVYHRDELEEIQRFAAPRLALSHIALRASRWLSADEPPEDYYRAVLQGLRRQARFPRLSPPLLARLLYGNFSSAKNDAKKALHAADTQLAERPDASFVFLWSDDCVQHIRRGLRRRGYGLHAERELTVIDWDTLETEPAAAEASASQPGEAAAGETMG